MSKDWICPEDRFPIMHGGSRYGERQLTVPMALVLEHEKQALANHGQSVARLKERSGLSWCELSAVLGDRQWFRMDTDTAHEDAMRRVLVWQQQQRAAALPSLAPGPGVAR